jgi:hypothetical protein
MKKTKHSEGKIIGAVKQLEAGRSVKEQDSGFDFFGIFFGVGCDNMLPPPGWLIEYLDHF